MDLNDFMVARSNPKRYSFVWNNDERTEAVIRDNRTNEIMLIRASEGTHSTKIIDELRLRHLNAEVLQKGQRIIVTKRGLVWENTGTTDVNSSN